MNKLKAAVIGLGRMGAEPSSRLEGMIPNGWLPISHVEAILLTPGLELVALCDQNAQKVEYFKTYYKVKNGFLDYKKLIDEIRPDLLSIATRTAIRPDIIRYAASAGVKMIYAEKPLCTSLTECDNLISEMQIHGVTFAYGVNRRYHNIYRKAKQLVKDGIIGEVVEIVAENGFSNLLWTHPHTTDLLLFFSETTKIIKLQGSCTFNNVNIRKNYVDDDPYINHAYFEFDNGIKGIISNIRGTNLRLGGTKGTLTIHGDGKYIEILTGEGYFYDRKILEIPQTPSATQNVIQELLDAFTNKTTPPISFKEVRTGLMMLIGVVQSSMENGSLIIPQNINPHMIITGKMRDYFP